MLVRGEKMLTTPEAILWGVVLGTLAAIVFILYYIVRLEKRIQFLTEYIESLLEKIKKDEEKIIRKKKK